MDTLFYLFAGLVAVACLLAGIAIWSPRRLATKLLALVLAAASMPLGYGALAELLSNPKPTNLEWVKRAAEDAVVLSAQMQEERAIYLWLAFAPETPPRAYALPWSLETAKELQQAMRQAESQGTRVKMTRPFAPRAEGERVFYAEPQQALPPKPAA